jgi:hypothetical protein
MAVDPANAAALLELSKRFSFDGGRGARPERHRVAQDSASRHSVCTHPRLPRKTVEAQLFAAAPGLVDAGERKRVQSGRQDVSVFFKRGDSDELRG